MSAPPTTESLLRTWRRRHALSLEDVSGLSGLSVATISRVERGQRNLAPLTKVKVARRLGVNVRDLFEVEELSA
ncbi:helix-turn-helix domain-containing protein [Actinomadura rugatobispora]|uniref:Helix-turn-helix domain-containing protein n=1 Tax=Actinomadura rugatobispora TaxID=1994 RepID=A0ABW1A5J8_9ACTN|nr:hypothetical protein GCM10010200_029130 [Actinomadura rugatobispora]